MKKSSIIIIAFITLCLIFSCTYIYRLSSQLNIQCQTYINQFDSENNYKIMADVEVDFRLNGSVTTYIKGTVNNGDKKLYIRRRIEGTYKNYHDHWFLSKTKKIVRSNSDNTPDQLINDYFFNYTLNNSYLFSVRKHKELWFIGSPFSQEYVCMNITQP